MIDIISAYDKKGGAQKTTIISAYDKKGGAQKTATAPKMKSARANAIPRDEAGILSVNDKKHETYYTK